MASKRPGSKTNRPARGAEKPSGPKQAPRKVASARPEKSDKAKKLASEQSGKMLQDTPVSAEDFNRELFVQTGNPIYIWQTLHGIFVDRYFGFEPYKDNPNLVIPAWCVPYFKNVTWNIESFLRGFERTNNPTFKKTVTAAQAAAAMSRALLITSGSRNEIAEYIKDQDRISIYLEVQKLRDAGFSKAAAIAEVKKGFLIKRKLQEKPDGSRVFVKVNTLSPWRVNVDERSIRLGKRLITNAEKAMQRTESTP